jgi:hypothetical protein
MKQIKLIQVSRANVKRYYPDPTDTKAVNLLRAFKQSCLSQKNLDYLQQCGIPFKIKPSKDAKYTNPAGLL